MIIFEEEDICDIYLSSQTLKLVTDLSGNITLINLEFQRVTGYSSDDLIGVNVKVLKHDQFIPWSYYKGLWDTITDGRMWEGIMGATTKDGSIMYAKGVVYPVFSKEKEIVAYCSKRILCSKYEIVKYQEEIEKIRYSILEKK